jgi:hypothetical protein
MKVRTLVVLAIFASLLSFAKFNHCENTGWATPDQYIHACYSDLPSLFEARGLSTNQWPYASADNSVEYPVLTGVVMYATSFGANSPANYFNINIFFFNSVIHCDGNNRQKNSTRVCLLSSSSSSDDRFPFYQLGSVGDCNDDAGDLLV